MNLFLVKARAAFSVLILLALAGVVSANSPTNSPAKLTLEDLIDATGLSSVALSPDGSRFA